MTEDQEPRIVPLRINLRPSDSPDAQDYYANLTGVVSTQDEIVLMFSRLLPSSTPPESAEVECPPELRVTVPLRIARNLLEQIANQLKARQQAIDEYARKEPKSAGSPEPE